MGESIISGKKTCFSGLKGDLSLVAIVFYLFVPGDLKQKEEMAKQQTAMDFRRAASLRLFDIAIQLSARV